MGGKGQTPSVLFAANPERKYAQVPLDNGADDATFHRLFKPIMEKVVATFQPGAVVLQCGAPPHPQHTPAGPSAGMGMLQSAVRSAAAQRGCAPVPCAASL